MSRVDIVYQRLTKKSQAWTNLLGCLFFMLPGCFLIIYTSIFFVADAIYQHRHRAKRGESAQLHLGGLARSRRHSLQVRHESLHPAGLFSLFFMQGVSLFIKSLFVIMGLKPPGLQESEGGN